MEAVRNVIIMTSVTLGKAVIAQIVQGCRILVEKVSIVSIIRLPLMEAAYIIVNMGQHYVKMVHVQLIAARLNATIIIFVKKERVVIVRTV